MPPSPQLDRVVFRIHVLKSLRRTITLTSRGGAVVSDNWDVCRAVHAKREILANKQEAVRRTEEVSNDWLGCTTESIHCLFCHLLLLDPLFNGSPVTGQNAVRLLDPSGQRWTQFLVSSKGLDLTA